jgi:hypothetical protein
MPQERYRATLFHHLSVQENQESIRHAFQCSKVVGDVDDTHPPIRRQMPK